MQWISDQLETLPRLKQRVFAAAKLGEQLERGSVVQSGSAAFVMPLGMRGGAVDAAAGLYRQSVERLVGVALLVRNVGDSTGAKALSEIEPLIEDVIGLLVGAGPDDAFDVLTLARGELVSIAAGSIIYQLDFALSDQLRIARP